jgi:hypothetical protein
MLFAYSNLNDVQIMFDQLHQEFGITDLGEPEKILGIRIRRSPQGSIVCDQEIYIDETLRRFNMEFCAELSMPHQSQLYLTSSAPNPDSGPFPYSKLVGSLNYIAIRTRPDISYIINNLCRFISKPAKEYWEAAKRVLRYLKGTKTKGILFSTSNDLVGYSDSNLLAIPSKGDRQLESFSPCQVVRLLGKVKSKNQLLFPPLKQNTKCCLSLPEKPLG